MKKHAYRARNINQFSGEKLREKLVGGRIIVAVDVAKHDFAAGFAGADGVVVEHVKFTHPGQTMQFLDVLGQLGEVAKVEVVMEPTGTYGDALRGQLHARGMSVFAVSPKRCHDAAEIFDGVPSLHDAKATMILARLHAQGLGKEWPENDQARRELRAAVERRELYADPLHRAQGRLEALLARHWPEYCDHLDPNEQKTALALLAQHPGPEAVAAAPEEAARFMAKYSRGRLGAEKIAGVVDSARHSLGVKVVDQERRLLRDLARQMLQLWEEVERMDKQIAELVMAEPTARPLAATVGFVTAAVLIAMLGPASSYESAGAYVKGMGLNLKEHSSGESKKPGTGLHITKRAPGVVRKYLWLAALRLIQRDPVARTWYQRRKGYQSDQKTKAVVALMRKYARGLWHVGRGAAFDAQKLFDTRRLEMPVAKVANG